MEQEYRELREKLCETARLLYERGLVSGTDGNISVRASEDAMLITPSGVSKRELGPASWIPFGCAEVGWHDCFGKG